MALCIPVSLDTRPRFSRHLTVSAPVPVLPLCLSCPSAPPPPTHTPNPRSVTINPPLYGADTPLSLFDEKLPYGWNLKHLGGCLLKRPDVPQVPGVTTPMTYFGMWKSYFAWHVVSLVVPCSVCA